MSRRMAVASVSVLIVLSGCAPSPKNAMRCEGGEDTLILAAQAVQSATMIPCITTLPVGWSMGGFSAKTGSVRFWLDSDRAGDHAVEVELSGDCDTSGATEVEPEGEVQRFEQPITREPELTGRRFSRFSGGCVTVDYAFGEGAGADLLQAVGGSLELVPRNALVTALEENRNLILCGAGAPECPGETS